ncbi:hypothetical protein TWF718_009711 [Orbilia javanica]|uniref:Uncharacterized protein n=1 Tax=Orbilia javanica TaxID=47235 RepID=A0AAN8MU54_9PEZI
MNTNSVLLHSATRGAAAPAQPLGTSEAEPVDVRMLDSLKRLVSALLHVIKRDKKACGVYVLFCSTILDWIRIVEQILSPSDEYKLDKDISKYIYKLRGLKHGLLTGVSQRKKNIPAVANNDNPLPCLLPSFQLSPPQPQIPPFLISYENIDIIAKEAGRNRPGGPRDLGTHSTSMRSSPPKTGTKSN